MKHSSIIRNKKKSKNTFSPSPLLQCGLLSMGHRRSQEPASMWSLHRLQRPSGHMHLLWHWVCYGPLGGYLIHHGPPWSAGDNLLHHGLLEGLEGKLYSGT